MSGVLRNWPFRLYRDGALLAPDRLDGGRTPNEIHGAVFLSDGEGRFRFENLPNAGWQIEVVLPSGKVERIDELQVAREAGHRVPVRLVELALSNEVPDEGAPSEDEGERESFDGEVRGPGGPLCHWPIRLLRSGRVADVTRISGVETTNVERGRLLTDAHGRFRFDGLPSDDWSIEVVLPNGEVQRIDESGGPTRETGHRARSPAPMAFEAN